MESDAHWNAWTKWARERGDQSPCGYRDFVAGRASRDEEIERLRSENEWLRSAVAEYCRWRIQAPQQFADPGTCCGEVDAGGTCMAPACAYGEVARAATRQEKTDGE